MGVEGTYPNERGKIIVEKVLRVLVAPEVLF
jgi:hypothetical protein